MEEKEGWCKEEEWRSDSKAFLWKVVWHWENVGTTVFGCAAISFFLGRGYVILPTIFGILANFCFLVACFRAWRDERRAKEKAMQPISGTWTRNVYKGSKGEDILGVMELSFDCKTLIGMFRETNIDHTIQGSYDEKTRRFHGTVERIHILAQEPRLLQDVTYWIIGDNTLLYFVPNNGFNEVEQGTFVRQNTEPMCSVLAPWSTRRPLPTPDKP